MKLYKIALCLLGVALLATSCDDDEDSTTTTVTPTATGTFVDERDGYEYHWVRIGGLDWMCENSHYDLNDDTKSRYYVTYEENHKQTNQDLTSEKYGLLYSQQGAQEAAPEGWRVPTDDDWKSLEMALGMSQSEADSRGWRGTNQADLMRQSGEGTMLGIQMAGYYTTHTVMATSGYRFMASYGYYWSQTNDPEKSSGAFLGRKFRYNTGQIYRESFEGEKEMLSVRFVRDAQ